MVSNKGSSRTKSGCSHISLIDSEEAPSAAGAVSTGANAEVLFGENYARLQKLKQVYDPDLVFFKWTPITPAS
jgi:FAD/FMN-containing dehydrogenase